VENLAFAEKATLDLPKQALALLGIAYLWCEFSAKTNLHQ
jgi:hypothetical protein